MTAEEIVSELRSRGFTLRVESGKLKVSPGPVPPEIASKIRTHRDSVFGYMLQESQPRVPSTDKLSALRRHCPGLWKLVRLRDGRVGLLWGLSPHGIVVSIDPKAGLLLLDPEAVAPFETEEITHAGE